MSVELLNAISSGGAGVAVIVVTVIFLKFLRSEREVRAVDRREERQEFLRKLEQASGAVERVSRNVAHTSTTLEQLTTVLLQRPCLRNAEIGRARGAKATAPQPEGNSNAVIGQKTDSSGRAGSGGPEGN